MTVEAISSTLSATQNARLARRFRNEGVVAIGFAGTALGLFSIWLAPTLALVAAGTAVIGAGWGIVLPSIDAAVSDLVDVRFRGGALSLRNSVTFLGRASGPFVFAGLAVFLGYRPLFVLAGVVALLAALTAWRDARRAAGDARTRL